MTKAKISEYDAVASNNTDVNGVNIAENCPPSGMNNMGREIMAALKRFQVGSDGDGVTVGGNLVVSGSSTLSTTSISSADINAGTIDATAIGGSTAAAGSFTTLNTSGQVVFNDAGADVDFRVEGDTDANLFFVDASTDRVGVGTSSPSARLSVVDADPIIKLQGNELSSVRYNRIRFANQPGSNVQEIYGGYFGIGGLYLADYSGTGILFGVSATPDTFTERMRIDSSGNLLVGTTSVNNAGVVSIDFDGQTKQGITLDDTYVSTGGAYLIFRNSSGNNAGLISHTGTTTVAYLTTSDYRLKENIQPMQNALATVAQLKPVTYTWKEDGSAGEGFIAHELQEVAPYAVTGEKDGEQMQGVDYGKITPLLTAALQEAIAEIQSLKARVAELEAK